jgi:sensor histidine kinase YesM
MSIHKKKQKLVYQLIAAAIISISIGNFFLWIGAQTVKLPLADYLWNAGYSVSIGLSLFSNGFFFNKIESRYISWIKRPAKSIFIAMGFHFLYSSLVIFFFNWLWFVVIAKSTWAHFLSFGGFIIIGEYIVFVIIASILYAKSFFKQWREEAIQGERLKQEAIALQYQVMQNQVNPHFLFNSLNVLGNLIDLDSEKAKEYITQLADFYRNLLMLKNQEIVPLHKEIEFVKRYVFLQKIRFGDNFSVDIHVRDNQEGELIPLSLQILIENSVKHNEISKEHPLEIVVGIDHRQYIFVENNLNLKNDIKSSNNIGLANLKERYRYLTGKEVEIIKNKHFFRVSLPLIKLEL